MSKQKQFKLSNVRQFAQLAKEKPAILLGPLRALQPLIDEMNTKGRECNCTRDINFSDWRDRFELAMQLLNSEDMDKLKALLNAEEICYNYKNETGSISLQCF